MELDIPPPPRRTTVYAGILLSSLGALQPPLNASLTTLGTSYAAQSGKGFSNFSFTLVVATCLMILAFPVFGWLADRYGPLKIVIPGICVLLVATLAMITIDMTEVAFGFVAIMERVSLAAVSMFFVFALFIRRMGMRETIKTIALMWILSGIVAAAAKEAMSYVSYESIKSGQMLWIALAFTMIALAGALLIFVEERRHEQRHWVPSDKKSGPRENIFPKKIVVLIAIAVALSAAASRYEISPQLLNSHWNWQAIQLSHFVGAIGSYVSFATLALIAYLAGKKSAPQIAASIETIRALSIVAFVLLSTSFAGSLMTTRERSIYSTNAQFFWRRFLSPLTSRKCVCASRSVSYWHFRSPQGGPQFQWLGTFKT